MDNQNQIELLVQLGLTTNQAKIYLACIGQPEPCTANQIAKTTKIAPEVVYRTIPPLQKMGLITKVITFPTEFEPTPIDAGINILLERKNKETGEIQAKATELLNNIKNKRKRNNSLDFEIVQVSGKERLVQFVGKKIDSAQKSLDIIGSSQKWPGWIGTYLSAIEKRLVRCVQVRIIVGDTKENHERFSAGLPEAPNFKIKFVKNKVPTCLVMQDNREVLIGTEPKIAFSQTPIYWSNNVGIVALCKTYFEKYW